MFQHTAARRRLAYFFFCGFFNPCFNTQPPEGGWILPHGLYRLSCLFQHTAARRRLGRYTRHAQTISCVSTHSRPKAAGGYVSGCSRRRGCFNTQPPEGGWMIKFAMSIRRLMFQHTAARRRLVLSLGLLTSPFTVSTHSRPKAAGIGNRHDLAGSIVSTHSRPKAAGPPPTFCTRHLLGFNTQPPEGGWLIEVFWLVSQNAFQHTAARRRLGRTRPN